MSSIRIVPGTEFAIEALRGLSDSIKSPRPLLLAIGESLAESTRERFSTLTSPDGKAWAANQPSTIENFLREFKGARSKRTGKLSKSGKQRQAHKKPLTGKSKSLRTTINYKVESGAVVIGSPMVYAGTQQFGAGARSFKGGKTPWGNIPARPFLGLSAADRDEVAALAQAFLEDSTD